MIFNQPGSIRKRCRVLTGVLSYGIFPGAIAPTKLPARRQVDHCLITVNVVTVNPFTFEFAPSLTSSKET